MTLRLDFQAETSVPVEVEGITPETVRELSVDQIKRLTIFHGNQETTLGEFFEVSGDASDEHLVFSGNLTGVHWIGAQMLAGRIDVQGSAGRHVGSGMRGGEIDVAGDAGDWVGGEMHGGLINVRGGAGHLIGAAYRGSARGMTGGTLLVHGNAGNEIGHSMRRGLIAIGGDIGDLAAFNMLAGTIWVGGTSGIRHAAGMRRGSLCFVGGERPPLLGTFRYACRYRPPFLALVLRRFQRLGFPLDEHLAGCDFDLFHGDLIEGGRGEILLSCPA